MEIATVLPVCLLPGKFSGIASYVCELIFFSLRSCRGRASFFSATCQLWKLSLPSVKNELTGCPQLSEWKVMLKSVFTCNLSRKSRVLCCDSRSFSSVSMLVVIFFSSCVHIIKIVLLHPNCSASWKVLFNIDESVKVTILVIYFFQVIVVFEK